MHDKPEIDENLRQYCIDIEQQDKYYDYVNCFVYGATGDSAKCIASANVDVARLNACIARIDQEFSITEQYNDKSTWQNDKYPKFDLHKELNEEYSAKVDQWGSPSIVINGKITEIATRSPENFKSIVCESFNIAPEKCSQTLSDEVPAPGFGYGIGGSCNGQCK